MAPEPGISPADPPGGASAILDTVEATARVLGNGALYLRMLRRFRDDHPPGALPIRRALDSADLALAHRLAHTLKGTAGMIGAHTLHEQASALEHSLRTAGAVGAAAALERAEQALHEVLVAVDRVLAGEPPAGRPAMPANPAAKGPLERAMLAQLAGLLDVGDGAAIDLLEQSGPALKAALGETGFGEVMLAAHAFDFEAALAALQRALQFDFISGGAPGQS
jgi:HPt (histidine-containing phosphotransfer) domain-containing protein